MGSESTTWDRRRAGEDSSSDAFFELYDRSSRQSHRVRLVAQEVKAPSQLNPVGIGIVIGSGRWYSANHQVLDRGLACQMKRLSEPASPEAVRLQ